MRSIQISGPQSKRSNAMSTEPDDHPDYDDGRTNWEWKTKYSRTAWIQICIELGVLALFLSLALFSLFDCITLTKDEVARDGYVYSSLLGVYIAVGNAKWVALALAGFIGGLVFDLKWLYHSVAKGKWHQDRCLWRLIVPFNSAMVSLFTGFLFASGVIPFLKNESFDEYYTLLGFGFVFGYFSDNILAALQNLAAKLFGTLDDS